MEDITDYQNREEMNKLERKLTTWDEKITKKAAKNKRGLIITGLLTVGFATFLAMVNSSARYPHEEEALNILNSQTATSCAGDQECPEFYNLILDQREKIRETASDSGVPPEELEALLAGSYLNPHRENKIAQGYRGRILLDPIEVGVTGEILEHNTLVNLSAAAQRYKALKTANRLPEEAVALFFATEADYRQAQEKAGDAYWKCHGVQSNGGACERLERYRYFVQEKNEWTTKINNQSDPEKRQKIQRQYDEWLEIEKIGSRYIRDDDIEWYEDFESRSLWPNNIADDYAREAIKIFYTYLGDQTNR